MIYQYNRLMLLSRSPLDQTRLSQSILSAQIRYRHEIYLRQPTRLGEEKMPAVNDLFEYGLFFISSGPPVDMRLENGSRENT